VDCKTIEKRLDQCRTKMTEASDRISAEFDRYLKIGHKRMAKRPFAERVVYYVVIARCEKDMAAFESIFEQALTATELSVLIKGLQKIGERGLAQEFARGLSLLQREGFYPRRDKVFSRKTTERLAAIGERVADRLWRLDEKLVALLGT
jgi:hypothetical protein